MIHLAIFGRMRRYVNIQSRFFVHVNSDTDTSAYYNMLVGKQRYRSTINASNQLGIVTVVNCYEITLMVPRRWNKNRGTDGARYKLQPNSSSWFLVPRDKGQGKAFFVSCALYLASLLYLITYLLELRTDLIYLLALTIPFHFSPYIHVK